MTFPFNYDTVVVACSGPSLKLVDPFSLGLPVVAISTTIRSIPNPHVWILADQINEMHGEEGKLAYSNSDILKVVPEKRVTQTANPVNILEIPYESSNRGIDIHNRLWSGTYPLIRGPHKSITFGIQWLHAVGIKKIIFCGNDLFAPSMKEKYSYSVEDFDMKKEHNFNTTLDQTANAMENWYPLAKQRGFEWFSWKCGERFERFVTKFDEGSFRLETCGKAESIAPVVLPYNIEKKAKSKVKSNTPEPTLKKIDRKIIKETKIENAPVFAKNQPKIKIRPEIQTTRRKTRNQNLEQHTKENIRKRSK
jgi:hypothetical protein